MICSKGLGEKMLGVRAADMQVKFAQGVLNLPGVCHMLPVASRVPGLTITQAASANLNDMNNILHENSEEWQPCWPESRSVATELQWGMW